MALFEVTSTVPIQTTEDAILETSSNSSWVPDPLPSMPSAIEAIIMYTIAVGAIISNIMVLYVLPGLKGKIRSQTRYCMISLVITDSLFGVLFFISKTIFITNAKLFMELICYTEGIIAGFLVDMTIVGITLLNIDRVFVILKPVTYNNWMTEKKFLIVLTLLWSAFVIRFIIVSSFKRFAEKSYLDGAYTCILKYNASKWLTATSIVVMLIIPLANCIASLVALVKILKMRKRVDVTKESKKSKESATVLSASFFLTTVYFFMAAPFCICVMIWHAVTGQGIAPALNFFSVILLACNSVVNPFIYLVTMKSFRYELLRWLKTPITCWKRDQQIRDESRFSTHAKTSF